MNGNRQKFVGRPQAYARAMTVPRHDHRIALTVAYMLISAIIVLWLAYLPAVTGSILKQLNLVPEHLTASETVDRAPKGDRLMPLTFEERWKDVASIDKRLPPRRAERIPNGCEGAFSRLIKAGNFSTRCVV